MKVKRVSLTVFFLLINLIAFSQQIGSGFAPDAIPSFNIELPSGFYQGYNAIGNIDGGGWNHLLNLRHSTQGNNHQLQIASSYSENDRLFFRKFARALGSSNPDWHEIATREGNTFNGNQIVNGEIYVSRSTAEGGALSLVNESKATQNAARQWTIFNMTGGYTNSLQFWSYGDNGYQSGPKFTISDGGYVGIGTQNPIGKFDVRGNVFIGTTDLSIGSVGSFVQIDQGSSTGNSYSQIRAYSNGGNINNNLILQSTNGNVGIGTTTPDKKLTVNGTIHSSEVIVDTKFTPDYVFQKYYTGKSELKSDYVMPTLAEIENFTKKNNHLPNVPSAQEVQQNGLSLGEMSNVLLQKVEELTLYAIEQNKKIMLQQEELERLKKENEQYKSLAERISALEKK